jgi:hypothetical protein
MFNEYKEFYHDAKRFYEVLKQEDNYDELKGYFKKHFSLFNRLIQCEGQENIVREGPNIIIANYTGMSSAIALIRAYDRQLYSVAANYLFIQETLKKKVKEKLEFLGPKNYKRFERIVNRRSSKPLETMIDNAAALTSERMSTFKMIPVDLDYDDNSKKVESQREVMDKIKDYLRNDRVIVLFQTKKNYMIQGKGTRKVIKEKSQHHNYLYKFSNTVSKIALELYNESLSIPEDDRISLSVTPVAFYTRHRWNPFSKTIMYIGKPEYISVYTDSKTPVPDFTDILEEDMARMLVSMGIPRNKNR